MRTVILRFAILITLAVSTASCAAQDEDSTELPSQCVSDSECQGEKVCRYGLCSVVETESREIGFRLIPPNSSLFRPQTVRPTEVSFEDQLNLGLRSSVRIAGRLLYSDTGGVTSNGPTGTLTFKRRDLYNSGFSQQQSVEEDSQYSVLLLPGIYDITFSPDDPSIPGKVWRGQEFSLDTNPQLTIPSRAATVNVRVVDIPGAGVTQARVLEDAKIVAIARDSGATSTVASTDASLNYDLSLYPDSGIYDLQVTTETEGQIRELLLVNAIDCSSECPNIIEFNLADLTGERVANAFVVVAPSESMVDLSGLNIEISSEFEWGSWKIRRTLEESPRVETFVPAGDYSVRINSPLDHPFSSGLQSVSVTGGQDSVMVSLNRRPTFTTSILTADGEPLVDARIELRPVSELAEAITTQTDSAGLVETPIEPTDYWLSIVPADTSLPRTVRYLSPQGLQELRGEAIRLPEPAVLGGSLIAAAKDTDEFERLPDVTVQAFEIVQDRAVTVGEATSAGDGSFRMVIPSEPPRPPSRQ